MTESVTLTEDLPPETPSEPWTEKTFLIEDRFSFVETRDQALRCYLATCAFNLDIDTPLTIVKLEALFQWVKNGATPADARSPSPLRRV